MSGIEYSGISGTKEYCTYPPGNITEFKYTNQACPFNGNEPVTQNNTPSLPQPAPHGGLYSDVNSSGKPWHSIPVMPDMNYMITQNLQSANPPPGATQQFIGTPRPGNNSVQLPGVYTYQPNGQSGMYNFHLLQ